MCFVVLNDVPCKRVDLLDRDPDCHPDCDMIIFAAGKQRIIQLYPVDYCCEFSIEHILILQDCRYLPIAITLSYV